MTDTLAPVEHANWGVTSLEFYPRPEWCPFGLVEWSGPSGGDWWPRVFTWGFFPPPSPRPHPYPPLPRLPPTGMVSLRSSWVVRTIWGRLVAPCLHLGGFSSSLPTPPPLPTPPRLPPTGMVSLRSS